MFWDQRRLREVLWTIPKASKGAKNEYFWQTSIEDQRPKLKILVINIEIEGMVDTGADVIIISTNLGPLVGHFNEWICSFKVLALYPK